MESSNKTAITPIIKQYLEIKKKHKDALVFFRVGDFYELFYNDAEIAAKILGITLTRKAVKNSNIPMSGVPYHSYETYLERLVKAGFKVAICEQTETPLEAKKLKKDVVDRAVVRIITAGTITEENILLDGNHNYLAAVYVVNNNITVAWVDISTGDFYIETNQKTELQNIIYRINAKELLVTNNEFNLLDHELKLISTLISSEKNNLISSKKIFAEFFNINITGKYTDSEIIVSSILLDYLKLTQKSTLPNIQLPKIWNQHNVMRLDFFTRRSLELDKKLNGEYKGSLRSIIDKTVTKEGKRLLNEWLLAPLLDIHKINDRLEAVEYFCNNQDLLNEIVSILKNTSDIVRIFTKLVLGRGGPRDLYALKESLETLSLIRGTLLGKDIPTIIKDVLIEAGDFSYLQGELKAALKDYDDLPVNIKNGSFVRSNYRQELEHFRSEYNSLLTNILRLQEVYSLKAKIPVNSLKIQNNNLMGYFIEVNTKIASHLLNNDFFIHKQTLSTCVRFTTKELIDLESSLAKARTIVDAFEENVYKDLISLTNQNKANIFNISKALAIIDVLTSFAILAKEFNLIKPQLNNSQRLKIVGGKHLVVERGLKLQEEKQFISNDCSMNEESYIYIITGPNMAGKSTFLRQNAIIIILAQMGCYVPAVCAEIGVVDAVFSRVGSSDNLYKGQSTFMVEMLETSIILSNATSKSFIILDEIGRGTSTYDGMSIAFGVLYYLHNRIKAKTLFATHYHELTELKNDLQSLKTFYMLVEDYNGELIFMHNVVEGIMDKSYGIYAAKLAGLPSQVIKKAEIYLNELEKRNGNKNTLPLFNNIFYRTNNKDSNIPESDIKDLDTHKKPIKLTNFNNDELQVIESIKAIKVEEITPLKALEILYDLKQRIMNTRSHGN